MSARYLCPPSDISREWSSSEFARQRDGTSCRKWWIWVRASSLGSRQPRLREALVVDLALHAIGSSRVGGFLLIPFPDAGEVRGGLCFGAKAEEENANGRFVHAPSMPGVLR